MTVAGEQHVVVERVDAAVVTADVLVIPSNSRGTFGEPWRSIVRGLGLEHPQPPIPHADIRVVQVDPKRSSRIRRVAFAATVDERSPTTSDVITKIGAALGKLSRTLEIREIATPVLGTGVVGLDSALSLEALLRGYTGTANPSVRLRIIESDTRKFQLLQDSFARLSRSPAEVDSTSSVIEQPPTWQELTSDARRVMEMAMGLTAASGSSEIHMEHLMIAIYRVAGNLRASFGQLSADGLISLAQRKSGLKFPLANPVQLSSMPALSTHVIEALAGARRIAGGQTKLTAANLLAGALQTGCDFTTLLLQEGVSATPTGNDGLSDEVSVMPEPASDTIPDKDLAHQDLLDLGREVDMLGSVMLASNTPLPLAIGLFGDWGSGKSFFMRMLDEWIRERAEEQREIPADQRIYCQHIRQVHFNAWHYADGNLWASLAATIFDGLVGEPDPDVQADKRNELGTATNRANAAKDARVDAEHRLREAQNRAGRLSTIVGDAVGTAVRTLKGTTDLQKELTAKNDELSQSASQFVAAAEAARSTGQQLTLVWDLARTELVRGRRRATIVWLTVAALVVIAVVVGGTFSAWQAIVIGTPVLLSAVTPALLATSRLLGAARSARQLREESVVQAQKVAAQAALTERLANDEVAARRTELERLRDRGARLHDLVRSARLSYGSKLSMVSQLRKDFEQLTVLLNGGEGAGRELQEAAATLCREGLQQPGADGTDPKPERTDVLDVDRIVLYIDDLDRCPAKVVVKVLQAVNLMLTFRLFVVVIGVDGRWLEASLSSHYDTLLRRPVEYLEKIIQLPFVLRPMSPETYSVMVKDLTATRVRAVPVEPRQVVEPSGRSSSDPSNGQVDTGHRADPSSVEPGQTPQSPTEAAPPASTESVAPKPVRRWESLTISPPESELMGKVGRLITTPRTTKRFVNTYRMIRVCADQAHAKEFSPDGGKEYQAVVVLLSLLMGCPDAKEIFDRVMKGGKQDIVWTLMRRPGAADNGSVNNDSIDALMKLVDVSSAEQFQRWIPLVSRFTYHLPSVIAPTPESV